MPIFTETFSRPIISIGAAGSGGVFNFALGDVPELTSYGTLYRTFRILKAQVILVPDQNVGYNFDSAPAGGSAALGRLAYAINDSASVPPPVNELDVLVDNGAKIKQLTRPIRINCRPQPLLLQSGTVAVNSTRRQWLDLDTGRTTLHNGISYWFSNNNAGGAPLSVNMYVKLTFQLKDPR